MDRKGQLTIEFIFIIGILLVIIVTTSLYITHQNELIIAMDSARNGVIEGISIDSSAVFPDDTYDDYEKSKESLLKPSSIRLVKINYTSMGFDSKYGKEKIQFNVTVTSNTIKSKTDKDSAGDRINYNLRKFIAYSFSTENLTNELYNPVFSKHYIYTTAKVKWI